MAWLWCLALALVLAPTLGHLHRTVHGPHTELAHEWAAGQAHADHDDHAGHDHGWIAGLFTAHDDDSTCRLFDQLTHSDALASLPALALPLVLTPFLFRRLDGIARARWATLFDARGPPVLR